MKKRIFQIIFAAILLLIACKKEESSGDWIEYKITHWPEVKTLPATILSINGATLNGTVIGYGLSTTVTFEYDANTAGSDIPTSYSNSVIASQSPVSERGIVYVSADISGLTPCLGYHFRIKAENSLWKKFYGSDQYFHTITTPTCQTTKFYGFTATTAVVEGDITDDGGSVIIERGVVYMKRSNTTGKGGIWLVDDSTGTGRFTINLSGLQPNTSYLVRTTATNCLGKSYGGWKGFKTLP